MRDDKADRMYEVNNLIDKVRTEFYELLDFDPDSINNANRTIRRREVLQLIAELRILAENV